MERDIRKNIKEVFGKGPEEVEINDAEWFLSAVVTGFLTKVEKIELAAPDGVEKINRFRYSAFRGEIAERLMQEKLGGKALKKVYVDVRADEDKACFTAFKKIIK